MRKPNRLKTELHTFDYVRTVLYFGKSGVSRLGRVALVWSPAFRRRDGHFEVNHESFHRS